MYKGSTNYAFRSGWRALAREGAEGLGGTAPQAVIAAVTGGLGRASGAVANALKTGGGLLKAFNYGTMGLSSYGQNVTQILSQADTLRAQAQTAGDAGDPATAQSLRERAQSVESHYRGLAALQAAAEVASEHILPEEKMLLPGRRRQFLKDLGKSGAEGLAAAVLQSPINQYIGTPTSEADLLKAGLMEAAVGAPLSGASTLLNKHHPGPSSVSLAPAPTPALPPPTGTVPPLPPPTATVPPASPLPPPTTATSPASPASASPPLRISDASSAPSPDSALRPPPSAFANPPPKAWTALTQSGAQVHIPPIKVKTKKAALTALAQQTAPGELINPDTLRAPGQPPVTPAPAPDPTLPPPPTTAPANPLAPSPASPVSASPPLRVSDPSTTPGNPVNPSNPKTSAAQGSTAPSPTSTQPSASPPLRVSDSSPNPIPPRSWTVTTDQGATLHVPATRYKTQKAALQALTAQLPPGQAIKPNTLRAPGQRPVTSRRPHPLSPSSSAPSQAPLPGSSVPGKTWTALTESGIPVQIPAKAATTQKAALQALAAQAPPGETIQQASVRAPGQRALAAPSSLPPASRTTQEQTVSPDAGHSPSSISKGSQQTPSAVKSEYSKMIGADVLRLPPNWKDLKSDYENPALDRPAEARKRENVLLARDRPLSATKTSDLLDLQALPRDAFYEILVKASLLIDLVHDRDSLGSVRVTEEVGADKEGKRARGNYWSQDPKNPNSALIAVSRNELHPIMTMIHEIGHHIEYKLGKEAVNRVVDTVKGTRYYDRIVNHSEEDGPEYLLKTGEIFARAYAQWIVTESAKRIVDAEGWGDLEVAKLPAYVEGLEELKRTQSSLDEWFQFWPESDFVEVQQALEAELLNGKFKLH